MQAVLATLGYVLSSDRRSALLIHRNARPDDHHFGKYNGLGGKLEPGEDILAGMRREIREEAGVESNLVEFAGTMSWPEFGPEGESWFTALFRITGWSGTPLSRNPEGDLVWTLVEDMLDGRVPMWPGDRHFLPLVFAEAPRQFHGVMTYERGIPRDWNYSEV